MDIQLLPCPFCGNRSFIRALNKKQYCQLHGEPRQSFKVGCKDKNCAVQPSVSAGDKYNGGEDKAYRDAATLWNTRLTPKVNSLDTQPKGDE